MGLRLCRSPLPLIPRSRPESPHAVPALLSARVARRTALMPVTYDDTFFDDLGAGLPAHSVKFLNRAASWSARNSHSGFVTATAARELTDDVGRDTGPLKSAGIIRRAGKGGWQITEGTGITIVNACDVAEQARQEQAEGARRRELGRIRAQRKRDKDKASRLAAMTAGVTRDVTRDVTRTSRGKEAGVTRDAAAGQRKPQVKSDTVTRYEARSSRVTPPVKTDRSNQDQSIGAGLVNARAREDPAVVADVTSALCEVTGRDDLGEPEAARAIGVIRERARKARKKIRSPKYFRTAVLNEADPYAELLLPPAPPRAEIIADPVLPPGAHEFRPDTRLGRDVCLDCDKLRPHQVHQVHLGKAS